MNDTKKTFDFDNDPEFNDNFYKNLESVLAESNIQTSSDGNNEGEIAYDITGEDIEDQLFEIRSSLAKQISEELSTGETAGSEEPIRSEEAVRLKKHKLHKLKIWNAVTVSLLFIIGIGCFLGFTKTGNHMLMSMGVNLSGTIWEVMTGNFDKNVNAAEDKDYIEQDDLDSDGVDIDSNTIVWPNLSGNGRQEAGIYNLLLLGEEAIGNGDARGRTDVMVIATMNMNDNTIKLTSLMRDTLVQIPGYLDNKINTVYEKGGVDLLYDTIALNFDIRLDGCALVNFESFERIIDELGGIEIPLTAGEARYLNNTNYISDPANRKVREGTHLMNGNQVLGYARVRKRANINGTNNDYGRTERHRIILNAIFDKYKTTGKAELASLLVKFLPIISTDIDSKAFQMLLNSFMKMGATEMDQLRIPADGHFKDNVKVRKMAVLIPDVEENIDILHSFIFGDSSSQNTETVVP